MPKQFITGKFKVPKEYFGDLWIVAQSRVVPQLELIPDVNPTNGPAKAKPEPKELKPAKPLPYVGGKRGRVLEAIAKLEPDATPAAIANMTGLTPKAVQNHLRFLKDRITGGHGKPYEIKDAAAPPDAASQLGGLQKKLYEFAQSKAPHIFTTAEARAVAKKHKFSETSAPNTLTGLVERELLFNVGRGLYTSNPHWSKE